jgi:hypothetical protein
VLEIGSWAFDAEAHRTLGRAIGAHGRAMRDIVSNPHTKQMADTKSIDRAWCLMIVMMCPSVLSLSGRYNFNHIFIVFVVIIVT